ncbi:DUF6090 family protein [Thalassotalea nanhaiensis]|uniref:DUF6090 family protein n=1 Tax=Thalassotalea nanhaiensis TaxID=3065648 RepID=A0ABY9TDQ3_9GAMM|nr:DUF6090 family protein [Colwelliaceae bacterium SQ345]
MLIQLKAIRNFLIRDGKFGKYLLYAIGELLLVVTGILIALQVNNFNVHRQLKEVEIQYYSSMKLQLMEDKNLIEIELSNIDKRIKTYLIGIRLIEENDPMKSGELGTKISQLLDYGDFRRKSSVYQTLISSGEIKNIKNLSIVANLQEIERSYEITERLEHTQGRLVMLHTAPVVVEVLDLKSATLINPELVYTPVFKNRFFAAIRIANEKKGEFEQVLSVINKTLKSIDDELVKS